MSKSSLITALPLLLCAGLFSPASGGETVVFQSPSQPSSAEASGFGDETVARIEPAKDKPLVLHLRDLPPHQFLKIDAVIDMNQVASSGSGMIRILGGAALAKPGGDPAEKNLRGRLQVSVDGADPVIDSSFGSLMGSAAGGSFPDRDGDFLHAPGTGSTHGPIDIAADAVKGRIRRFAVGGKETEGIEEHRVSFVIPHSGADAELQFTWQNANPAGKGAVVAIAGMGIGGSSSSAPFSVKNITASVIDAPVELDPAGVSARYEALGSDSPVDAMSALNELVLAGHSVLPLLGSEISRPGDPDLEKKFAEALKAMDDPSFEIRAAAAKSLTDFGAEVIPLARRTLAENNDGLSIEVKNTLEGLADRIEKGTGALADQSRTNRLHRLLDILGGDDAEKLQATLSPAELVVAPALAPVLGSDQGGAPGVIEMDFGGLKGVDGAGGAVFKFEAKGGLGVRPLELKVAPKVAPAPTE